MIRVIIFLLLIGIIFRANWFVTEDKRYLNSKNYPHKLQYVFYISQIHSI